MQTMAIAHLEILFRRIKCAMTTQSEVDTSMHQTCDAGYKIKHACGKIKKCTIGAEKICVRAQSVLRGLLPHWSPDQV